jgi:SAM-dependent methyltransferase
VDTDAVDTDAMDADAAGAAVVVDPANAEQRRAWDGGEGAFWASHADRFDRSAAAQHRRLFEIVAIAAGEQVLDVGCGTGQTTRDAARAAVDGGALGVDLSAAMLDVARQRSDAEGLRNVRFLQADAQIHPFEAGGFDVVVSRTGTMFFADLAAAFANIARALRPGGRLAISTWQPFDANEWIRSFIGALGAGRAMGGPPAGAPGPFALSQPERIEHLLTDAGFGDVSIEPLVGPMWFGHDVEDAERFVLGVSGWMLDGLDDEARTRALDDLRETLAAHRTADGVEYDSAAWITSATKRG